MIIVIMKARIQERLREIEKQYGFRIIYACESGSRAWGFASEDSDFDVRFIYCWSPEQYLGIYDPVDQVDLGVDRENLDFSGWDLRKALPLFRKSNGVLMEWLHSPIMYFEEEETMEHWRSLAEQYFLPKATTAHYLGLCRKIWLGSLEKDEITAKKYLYVLRSLLSARYICENLSIPPVEFFKTLNALEIYPTVRGAVDTMIVAKANQKEAETIPRISVLDDYIEEERLAINEIVSQLPNDEVSVEDLDRFFRNTIGFQGD